jgi:hypothetical protein
MRTTVTLDEDVAVLLREEAERSHRPFKQVLNQAVRLGLQTTLRQPFRTKPHSFGFNPGIDPDKLNQLLDEMEVAEFSRKSRKNRAGA